MPAAAITVFLSVLWLLVVFVVTALWSVALSDIASRTRGDLFTKAQLVSVAAVVSAAAVLSVGASSAVLFQARTTKHR